MTLKHGKMRPKDRNVYFNIFIAFLFGMFLILQFSETHAATNTDYQNLLNATLNASNYSSKVRPKADTGLVLPVTVDFYLVALNEINENEQKITTTGWLDVQWNDTYMIWNSASYANIDELLIPQNEIWRPDIALINALESLTGLGDSFAYVKATDIGTMKWTPYQTFESTCNIDMTSFPFDKQTCDIKFTTWSSTTGLITLSKGTYGINTAYYEPSPDWDLVRATTGDASTSTTSGIKFTLTFKRKYLFYLLYFILPIFLLAAINIFVFILPPASGEKTGFAVIAYLSFIIFFIIITDLMPEGMKSVPILNIYLLTQSTISCLIVFVTVLQLRLYSLSRETTVPAFLLIPTIRVVMLKRRMFSCKKNQDKKRKNNNLKLDDIDDPEEEFEEKTKFKAVQNKVFAISHVGSKNKISPNPPVRTELKPSFDGKSAVYDEEEIDTPNSINSISRNKKTSRAILAKRRQALKGDPTTPEWREAVGLEVSVPPMDSKMTLKFRDGAATPRTVQLSVKEDEDDKPLEASDVTWAHVVRAMDFIFFWTFSIVTFFVIVTTFGIVASSNA
ncbi:hypothetical protein CHS0354_041338 [Potamilus streckersoni]|uniref:Uncharacterized protein n=1 Tax=Potamilus streckersoni TaxID=2493646 RepID=A0AAE0SFB6_9BIVA|nr:hypothetical protein CHS0354_041338 [Potamilus streckersoni]